MADALRAVSLNLAAQKLAIKIKNGKKLITYPVLFLSGTDDFLFQKTVFLNRDKTYSPVILLASVEKPVN